ncbi:unnamed protein product [Callosobruchus maculatus]|uniref:Uncharacterized protein n=1 Tax=Callosobruchus maculatus TaxID=64391 RepID=A0A653CDN7_CALMS|nr:unnamed protein product [Callosobruchus maculatus]
MRILDTSGESWSTSELSLTTLRKKWCSRECIISEFLEYLVKHQDVPGPIPGPPVVTDTGRNWVSLSWGRPEHRGAAPVIAYRVEAWRDARWAELGVTATNCFDAFDLTPGGQYQFRVTPRNRYGWGEAVQSAVVSVGSHAASPDFAKVLPGQMKALSGADVTLVCEVKGEPFPTIRWLKDSSKIYPEDDTRYSIGQDSGICSLQISNLQDVDSGRFTCEAENSVGRVSTFARLCVVKDPKVLAADHNLRMSLLDLDKATDLPPQFTMRLRDRRVQFTYPVRLTCQVAGIPEPTVTWYRDGKEILSDDRRTLCTDENFHTLEISRTHLEDSGVYSVTAKNSFGAVSCRCNLVVDKGIKGYISPAFCNDLEPSQVEVREGRELRLCGRVEAYPSVGVMWYRDGAKLRPSRRAVMTLSHDGRLELSIAGVTKQDGGAYTCVASNEVGRAESTAKVVVLDRDGNRDRTEESADDQSHLDVPYSKEPKFLKKPMSTEAFEGDNIVILCEVIGDPKPEVVWLRDFLKVSSLRMYSL